ncbi:srpk, putative [Talaromyces stipitatus ATCC 10500]|uniref:non-specific serine/threonine protein kinase n=1 Tax=Talaromyces stipitatus (strain ATCC 10500 / CBS 375.48 / QM 6759 / NRRL 1006) TaxID=441959 RepID=B8MHW7_TALSN|nr:srpk, putative [Talaromyces stipitatus ATCC 10500]EED16447.1 srpk, putative [Talaromyces stipitatus ATCC 10500]
MESKDETTSQLLYEPLEGVERLEYYRPGGYHPVKIGDEFHDRYRVIHKLGYGSYSTTWLAYDRELTKYLAIKVCTANSNPVHESRILSRLTSSCGQSLNKPGRRMVPSILDNFTIKGPNGEHACYVTVPARGSLSAMKDARALAAQLALAVDYIHSQGVVHGDLHLGNVLLEMPPNFDKLSVDELHAKYGAPEQDRVVHLDGRQLPPGVPSHGIIPMWLGEASENLLLTESNILLTDFGESFLPSEEKKYESHTPLVMRPPETWFQPERPLSFESDIWTLACSIWTIIAQRPLFEGFLATQDDIICEQVDALGILPPEWWQKWGPARQERFHDDGKPKYRNPFRSWEDRFEDSVQEPRKEAGISAFDEEEKNALFSLLWEMLKFRPEERLTAHKVLQSDWMVKWALPEYDKIRE